MTILVNPRLKGFLCGLLAPLEIASPARVISKVEPGRASEKSLTG